MPQRFASSGAGLVRSSAMSETRDALSSPAAAVASINLVGIGERQHQLKSHDTPNACLNAEPSASKSPILAKDAPRERSSP